MNKMISRVKQIPKRHISFIFMAIGAILTILPIIMPNTELLVAITKANGSYLTAIFLSKFMGIRFGLIITFGIALLFIGVFVSRQK